MATQAQGDGDGAGAAVVSRPVSKSKARPRHAKDESRRLQADPHGASVTSEDAKSWREAWSNKVLREGSDSLQLIRHKLNQAFVPRTSTLVVPEPRSASPPKTRPYVMKQKHAFGEYINSPVVPGCDYTTLKYESNATPKHSTKKSDYAKLVLRTEGGKEDLVFDKVRAHGMVACTQGLDTPCLGRWGPLLLLAFAPPQFWAGSRGSTNKNSHGRASMLNSTQRLRLCPTARVLARAPGTRCSTTPCPRCPKCGRATTASTSSTRTSSATR